MHTCEHSQTAQVEPNSTSRIASSLQGLFSNPNYKPPRLPEVALELVALVEDSDVAIGKVVRVLEKDPLLAGEVLKRVQRPLYAGVVPIKSLRDACVRIGLSSVRDVVLSAALDMEVFKLDAYGDFMHKLQRHSRGTAHAAKVICRYTGQDAEYAFMCGLLADIGVAGLLLALHADNIPACQLEAAWPVISATHESASGLIAQLWGLPQDICTVLMSHHQPIINGNESPIIATIQLATALCDDMGYGIGMGSNDECSICHGPVDREKAIEILGIDSRTLTQLKKDVRVTLTQVL